MKSELLKDETISVTDRNVAVSAGAGSGKTFSLANRFVHILNEKSEKDVAFKINNIVAVTFTKMAALEMKERIRNFLRLEVEQNPKLRKYFREFEKANIVTLDSLQAKILRSHPVETGLDPNFAIVEGSDYDNLEQEIVRKFFHEKANCNDHDLEVLLSCFRFEELIKYIRKVMEHRSVLRLKDEDLLQGYSAASRPKVEAFLHFMRQYLAFWKQELLSRNILGYGDVTARCVELLRSSEEVRRGYQNHYAYLMVDEFQDTNDAQRELVYLLCGDGDIADKNGDQLAGDKLYVVGDVNQSIYGFRGADAKVFERVKQDIAIKAVSDGKDDSVFSKTVNRRSTDKILNLVNLLFGDNLLLGDRLEKLSPCEDNISGGKKVFEKPVIKFFVPETDLEVKEEIKKNAKTGKETVKRSVSEKAKVDAAELIKWEAEYVAKRIEELHSVGEKYEDMAILLPKMTKLPLLAEALNRHNIPYISMGGGGFYRQQEIYDILNLFRVLNGNDFIALLGVLRSPYFGLKDRAIYKLVTKYDAFRKCVKEEEKNAAICGAMLGDVNLAVLASLRRSATSLGMAELWQEVFDRLSVERTLLLQEQGRQCLANVEKLRTLSVEYCEKNKCGLGEWLFYLDNTMDVSKETQANIPAEGNVQIMTIHRSKGLGFEHVILPFLHKSKGQGDRISLDVTVEKETGKQKMGMVIPFTDDTSCYYAVKENNKDLETEEEKRKFYVAVTRAKKTLYMSACFSQSTIGTNASMKKNDTYGGWTWRVLCNFAKRKEDHVRDRWDSVAPEIVDIEKIPKGKFELTDVSTVGSTAEADYDKQFEVLADKKYEIPSRITFTPTMLQTYLHCPRSYYYRYVCGLPEVDEGQGARSKEQGASEEQGNGLTPAEMGTLIHSALEHYDGDIETAWTSALRAQGSGFRTQDSGVSFAKTLFVNYVNSDLFKQIPQQHDREVKFQLPIDNGVSFQGIMDCVYQKPDGNYGIVDYKTGAVPEELNEGYAMQLAIYAKAVEQMYRGAEVSELALHYLQGCVKKPVSGGKLQEAVALAKKIQEQHTETDFDCKTEQCAHCGYQYLCRKGGKE